MGEVQPFARVNLQARSTVFRCTYGIDAPTVFRRATGMHLNFQSRKRPSVAKPPIFLSHMFSNIPNARCCTAKYRSFIFPLLHLKFPLLHLFLPLLFEATVFRPCSNGHLATVCSKTCATKILTVWRQTFALLFFPSGRAKALFIGK